MSMGGAPQHAGYPPQSTPSNQQYPANPYDPTGQNAPPGMKPRVISLLSGGQKTLTAVALLLSIFRTRPSPFCILDEVDAAMDEANVDRFTKVIQSFLHHSHFVVITHNKMTMSVCDLLFGITMQDRGVSKRVAVNFEQVGSDGRIAPEAITAQDRYDATLTESADVQGEVEESEAIQQETEVTVVVGERGHGKGDGNGKGNVRTSQRERLADLLHGREPIESNSN